jgi:flagellar assembly factor FliW
MDRAPTDPAPQPSRHSESDGDFLDFLEVTTARFGVVRIPRTHVIDFPLGVFGLPDATTFALLQHRPGSIFHWLQALAFPQVAFVVAPATTLDPDYPVADIARAVAFLDLPPDAAVETLLICTIPRPPAAATVNMLAPVCISVTARRGAQITRHDHAYDVRAPLVLPSARAR